MSILKVSSGAHLTSRQLLPQGPSACSAWHNIGRRRGGMTHVLDQCQKGSGTTRLRAEQRKRKLSFACIVHKKPAYCLSYLRCRSHTMQFALPFSPTPVHVCRTHRPNASWRGVLRPRQLPQMADTRRCGCKSRVKTCAAAGTGQDAKILKETAALDQLIDLLMEAKSQQQLAKLVTDNVLSLDQKFWLRLATRSDTAPTKQDKEKIGSLANTVMTMTAALVKQTEGQLDQSTTKLQTILIAASNDQGEWHLPLTQSQSNDMRQAMDEHLGDSDEAILSTAFSWMRKAADDKQDGMISLIQKMLQLYAAKALRQPGDSPSPVDQVIQADEEQWEPLIRQLLESDQTTESDFSSELQKRMEGTVLGQSSGSYKQRVQAEYLKEIEARFKGVHQSILDQKAV